MAKKSLSDLKALLTAEKSDAMSAMRASKLSAERTKAMDYYNGDMQADMPAQDGRSKAVSSDVADTIEGLMPSLMEIFAGSDEVVRFEPVGPEDVTAAEQETDYVNHVFMQQNPGFLVLYSFIKDALLSKVGIVKVWWKTDEEEQRETYLDLPDDAFAMLAANPAIEIVEHSARPASPPMPADAEEGAPEPTEPGAPSQIPQLHDVTIVTRKPVEQAVVEGVPPEEFGISRHARSIRDCGYCYHEVIRREEELIADGYDADQVKAIPSYTALTNSEEIARDTVDEHLSPGGDDGMNEANRLVKITEHYVRMDYEGNGKVALYRVATGGDQGEVLKRAGEPQVIPEDAIPFAAMTPVIVTHRFFGRSIADLVMDIQRVKTALMRAILDNAYLAVNPRVEVSEAHASDTTLDDLLVSRPGGIVRTKMPGGLNWQTVPAIAGEIFPVLEYADQTREWRTGVSRQQQGLDANALQNQTATAAMQGYNASQAKMKLIARIFAETGIRDLFQLLHGTIRKHGSQAATVRLRNQWVSIDPRDWKQRNDMTVTVGVGAGGKNERLAQLGALINLQKDAVAAGLTNLVTPKNLYNSAVNFAKLADFKNYTDFFADPSDPQNPAPQARPDPKMMQLQAQNELEQQRQKTEAIREQAKMQADSALAQQKFDLDARMAMLNHELKVRDQQFQHTHQAITAAAGTDGAGNAGAIAPLVAHLTNALAQANAPKRVIRDQNGQVVGVEPVPHGSPVQ